MPLRAVLFDFGHTLVDFRRTQEALLAAYEQIRGRIEAAGYMQMPEILDLIERVAGAVDQVVAASYEERRLEELDLVKVFGESLEAIGYTLPPDVVDHIVELDHAAYANSLEVPAETMRTLGRLREEGYALGLVSNVALLPGHMRATMAALGLAEHLGAMAFSSEVGVRKPDPRIFRSALDTLGVPAEEAVHVGDRLHDDVAGARSVGMRTVLTHEYRQETESDIEPDAVIARLDQLPEVLAGWRSAETVPR